jgi:hypothetical protein
MDPFLKQRIINHRPVQANASPPVAKLLAPTDKKLQKIKASRSAGIKEKVCRTLSPLFNVFYGPSVALPQLVLFAKY